MTPCLCLTLMCLPSCFSVQAYEPELTVLLYNKDGELVHLPLVSSGLAELE